MTRLLRLNVFFFFGWKARGEFMYKKRGMWTRGLSVKLGILCTHFLKLYIIIVDIYATGFKKTKWWRFELHI